MQRLRKRSGCYQKLIPNIKTSQLKNPEIDPAVFSSMSNFQC
jgi:hypothetical protein